MRRGGGDQCLAAPVAGAGAPVAVSPQHARPVALYQVQHLGVHDIVDIRLAGISAVRPVEHRVAGAEDQVGAFTCSCEFTQHVARRTVVQHRAIGVRGVPPAQPVVVFGHHHRVGHPGVACEPGPFVGVEFVEGEERQEIVVVLDVAPAVTMVGERLDQRRRLQEHIWHVPIDMGAIPACVLPDRGPRRNGGKVGVHEQPKSSLCPPRRRHHLGCILPRDGADWPSRGTLGR